MLKNLLNTVRSAIVSAYDRLLIWAIRRRGYDVVYPLIFERMATELKNTHQYIRQSGALCTNTGKIPRAKKKLLKKIGMALAFARISTAVRP